MYNLNILKKKKIFYNKKNFLKKKKKIFFINKLQLYNYICFNFLIGKRQ